MNIEGQFFDGMTNQELMDEHRILSKIHSLGNMPQWFYDYYLVIDERVYELCLIR
jgi:hypothetical protein